MKLGNLAVYLLCTCLLLTGCGTSGKDPAAAYLGFSLEETRIVMNAPASSVLNTLNSPLQYTETASCAFDGVEKTYYFGSFYLTTYPSEEGDRIGSVWFADDTVSTEEGIRIGSDRSAVLDAYGEEAFLTADSCVVSDGNCNLTILLTGDAVSSVVYESI